MSGTLGQGIFAYLSTLSCGPRVYPLVLPERGALPAITWQLISGQGSITSHDDVHSGTTLTRDIMRRARLQFSCWGATAKEAYAMGEELERAIHAFSGQWGNLDVGSFLVDFGFDDYDEKRGVYRRLIDGMIQYTETSGS